MSYRQRNRFEALIFSMLTAIVAGGVLAFVIIFIFRALLNTPPEIVEIPDEAPAEGLTADISLLEEADQDPSFVSRFSRVFIYSSDDGKEVIANARSSISKTDETNITASAYAVVDLDRNATLLEENAEQLLPMASITKLVTAVVAKKLLDQNTYITVTKRALATYGNEAWLREGEKLKGEELLYPLLMVSSNDASEVLAQSYSKGRTEFIKEMNSWANSIGAYRTYFADPSGLSYKNVSTAKDLAIIAKWIYENEPEIFDITLLKSKTIRTHTWTNPTHFLNLTSYVGGKNGYTPEADRTSIALFSLGNPSRLYAVILLDSSARDSDILDLLEEALR